MIRKQIIYGLSIVGLLCVVLYVTQTLSSGPRPFKNVISNMNVIVSDESSTKTSETINNMVADINTYTKENMTRGTFNNMVADINTYTKENMTRGTVNNMVADINTYTKENMTRGTVNNMVADINTYTKENMTRGTVNNMVADINTYTKDNMIPRIIHQVWDDEIIPTQFVEDVKGLIAHNNAPDWQYYFWTHNSSRAFIRDKFPKFLNTFDNYPEPLFRADAIRYFVLYEYGGVYFDLDTVSVKPLDTFVRQAKHTCVLTTEPEEHYVIRYNMKLMLSNNAMLCRRRHPYFRFLIDILPSFVTNGCKGVSECTGPRFFTKAHEMYTTSISHPNDTIIISPEYFQDVYDTKLLWKHVHDTCHGMNLHNDKSRVAQSCKTWFERGGENRNISSKAYTYHTWYHINNNNKNNKTNVSFQPKNNITLIVPHVKIYKSKAPI